MTAWLQAVGIRPAIVRHMGYYCLITRAVRAH
jgi:hypothetical protein